MRYKVNIFFKQLIGSIMKLDVVLFRKKDTKKKTVYNIPCLFRGMNRRDNIYYVWQRISKNIVVLHIRCNQITANNKPGHICCKFQYAGKRGTWFVRGGFTRTSWALRHRIKVGSRRLVDRVPGGSTQRVMDTALARPGI